MRKSFCVVSLLLACALSGCGKILPKFDEVLPDRRTEYKKSKSLPDLEVPPELTTDAIQDRMAIPSGGETARYSTYQERAAERKRNVELERSESGAIKLLENEHVLVVDGATIQIWPRLREFWQNLGYNLELDDEELGVIETAWNENQEELVRDKFKVFAEPGQEPGTTVLYVSHRGQGLTAQGDNLEWLPRERDVALERKLVERLEEELGGLTADTGGYTDADSVAETSAAPRAELVSVGGGKIYLSLAEEFADAWRSTGSALSRAGIEVEQEDRSRGLYFVRMPAAEGDRKKGMSRLKFWASDENEYQLSLTEVGSKTELVVLDEDGKWETSESAGRLLDRLNAEFNATL